MEEYIEATEKLEKLIKESLNRAIYYLNNGLVGEAIYVIYSTLDGMDDSDATIVPDMLNLHMKYTQPVKIKKAKKINLRDIDGYQRSMIA